LSRRRVILACACVVGTAAAAPATTEALPEEQPIPWSSDAIVPDAKRSDNAVEGNYLRLHREAAEIGAEPGRNILLNGVDTRDGRVRMARHRELRRSISILERMTAPAPAAPAAPAQGGAVPATGGSNPALDAIAACESSGDPGAVGGGGLYRGKYQFSYETWQSVGGTGDPAAASEAEQDARAAMLLERDGAGHWPVCGG
jgi:Transglycosylase-like domain